MIQRIQTIYLLLAGLALSCPIFLPLATASGDAASLASTGDNFFADGTYWAKEFPGWMGTLFLMAGAVYAIFLYKNRPRQMQTAGAIALGTFILCGLFGVLGYFNAQELPEGATAHLSLGSALPVLAIPLLLMAYRAIKKDEALVRSSDRLR